MVVQQLRNLSACAAATSQRVPEDEPLERRGELDQRKDAKR